MVWQILLEMRRNQASAILRFHSALQSSAIGDWNWKSGVQIRGGAKRRAHFPISNFQLSIFNSAALSVRVAILPMQRRSFAPALLGLFLLPAAWGQTPATPARKWTPE